VKNKLTIGTRGSELALWQSNWVKDKLAKRYPDLTVEIEIIKTKGDKVQDVSLTKIGDKGLFTREIEYALLDGRIDLAVHSYKDLPTVLPEGLSIGAVTERFDQRDVLISKKYSSIKELHTGAKVATGSLRRRAQLLNFRGDLEIVDIRGNIKTRLRKFDESDWDAMVLAFAGIGRLSLEGVIKQIIPTEIILPAVSQGVMAVEVRENDREIIDIVKVLNDKKSEIETTGERSFLNMLEGGCQVPIGVFSSSIGGKYSIEGMVASLNGKKLLRDKVLGDSTKSAEIGKVLAMMLKNKGADEILNEIRTEVVHNPDSDVY
jgi:hydroxymethylbilane synthase